MDNETRIALRNVLANLYSDVNSSKLLLKNAGIPDGAIGMIAFNNAATINWFNILIEVENQDMISELVETALKNHPKNPLLKEVSEKGKNFALTCT